MAKTATKAEVGRPSILSQVILQKCVDLFEKGYTDVQVAKIIGVHSNTILNWRKQSQEFMWSTQEAKMRADEMVEASLFHRAIGYSHPEEKVFCSEGQIITHETTRHYPPEPHAMIFWLKNRKPDDWKDKREVTIRPNGLIRLNTGNGTKEFKV